MCEWADLFVEGIKDLTCNGCKVLLVYDGYRSHMSFKALDILRRGNVVVYALPAHTSGTTQLLDVAISSPWKVSCREYLRKEGATRPVVELDLFGSCRLLKQAYKKAFSTDNIRAGFRKTGLWPIDATELLSTCRQLNESNLFQIVNWDTMMTMVDTKRKFCI